jgi:hypothetical protein
VRLHHGGKNPERRRQHRPPGAECGLYREQGIRLATIQSTPGKALIEKTKADMWIVCVKQGYEQATFYNKSGVAPAAFANVIGGVFTLGIATVVGLRSIPRMVPTISTRARST